MADEVTEIVQEEIKQKGYTITRLGRQLIARSLATHTPMVWTGIMMGRGVPDETVELPDVEALADPVAAGTSTMPQYLKDRVNMTVEFRSDMVPAGMDGFYITEFGIYGKLEGDEEEILFVYGCQGDYPVWVGQYADGCTDIRRWPISLVIGSGLNVSTGYSPASFMTAEDIAEYTRYILLPMLTESLEQYAQERVAEHDSSMGAHSALLSRFARIEDATGLIPLHLLPAEALAAHAVHPELFTLEPDGWAEDDGRILYRLPMEAATMESLPLVSFWEEYGDEIAACGMSEDVKASDGALTFWAESIPENPISGCAFLLCGEPGPDVQTTALRPATGSTLGVIKGSDSIQIDADGTAHAVLSGDMFVPDATFDAAVQERYGKDKQEENK